MRIVHWMAAVVLATGWPAATVAATVAVGSPEMPASFGKPVKPWFGCPRIAGVYAWPPVEGSLAPDPGPGQRGQFANIAGLQLHANEMLAL